MAESSPIQTTTLQIEGVDCPDEIEVLRKALGNDGGIRDLAFNLMRATRHA